MQLKDSLVVITGASRGIGRAMAHAFAARDAQLALLDLDEAGLEQTLEACKPQGDRSRIYRCNVADEQEVITTFAQIAADFGRIDVLINNAGILRDALLVKRDDTGRINKMSLTQWQSVIDINLTGVFLCGREAAEHMVKFGHGGVIINLSSVSRTGNVGQSNYSAAKAGVAALTVVWAKELSRYGIRTGAIAPGAVLTDILKSMRPEMLERMLTQVPLRRGGQPEEIAHAALFIVENDYFTGRVLELDGGFRV